MQTTLGPILDVFDEGLLLYRREFLSFVVLSAAWLVPIAVGVGLSLALVANTNIDMMFLVLLLWGLLSLPMTIYLIIGISTMTIALQEGRTIGFRELFEVPLVRIVGMICYAILFSVVINIILSFLLMLCVCPSWIASAFLLGGLGTLTEDLFGLDGAIIVLAGILIIILFTILYILSLVVGGATYSSLIYALQPFFIHPGLSFTEAIQRSIDLITYRIGQNSLAFVLASALFGAVSLSVTVAIAMLLPMPLFVFLGEHSPIAQGASASAWLIGFVVILPPMPIWMTLWYQRRSRDYDGDDIAEAIRRIDPTIGDTSSNPHKEM